MNSTGITQLLQQDSHLLVFVNVVLQQLGYRNAYPLRGGSDAWKAAQETLHKQ